MQDKFLKHVDGALLKLLHEYKLPVFLVGVDRIIGHFRKISSNNGDIVDVIHGNYQDLSLPQIKDLLQPHVDAWKERNRQALLEKIEDAAGASKLTSGIREVWRAAKERKGRMLIVEKNYIYPAKAPAPVYTRDAVDEVIREVVKGEGEVRFVEEGLLDDHIALIRHY